MTYSSYLQEKIKLLERDMSRNASELEILKKEFSDLRRREIEETRNQNPNQQVLLNE